MIWFNVSIYRLHSGPAKNNFLYYMTERKVFLFCIDWKQRWQRGNAPFPTMEGGGRHHKQPCLPKQISVRSYRPGHRPLQAQANSARLFLWWLKTSEVQLGSVVLTLSLPAFCSPWHRWGMKTDTDQQNGKKSSLSSSLLKIFASVWPRSFLLSWRQCS